MADGERSGHLKMSLVFIDANVYLSAYKRRIRKYRELLKSVEALSSILLVTRMVTLEFERNKAQVYRDNIDIQKLMIREITELYAHYTEDTKEVDGLNRQIRQLREKTNRDAKALYE